MFGCCSLPICLSIFGSKFYLSSPSFFSGTFRLKKIFFRFGSYYRKLTVTYEGLKSAEDINFITLSNMIDAFKHILAMFLN